MSKSTEAFTPEAVSLAASIGQQIALTLDNLALVEQVQTQARRVAGLQERERIAGEIHDSVAQTLGYLYLQTDRLAHEAEAGDYDHIRDQLFHMQNVLSSASHDIRQFIARLHDVAPPPSCLPAVLRDEAQRMADELALPVTFSSGTVDDVLVPAATGTELARIVGEALRNAQRHGHAQAAHVVLHHEASCGTLFISDNGAGFDPDQPLDDGRSHFGLNVMRARAQRIGGSLVITSRPGAGTRIEVRWPIVDVAPLVGDVA